MGSLRDQLKNWKARGKAQVESLERAKSIAGALSKGTAIAPPTNAAKSQGIPQQPLSHSLPASSPTAVETTALAAFETSGFRPLGKAEHYRHPEGWVELGNSLQAPGFTGGRALTVRVGIDFGTAYTKVAINAAGTVFLVDWSGVTLSEERYFLPGVVSMLHGGASFLGRCSTAAEYLSDLKLPFLPGQSESADRRLAASIFLAWVMKYARAWFFHHQAALCKGRQVIWEVNIGCPTDAWDDKVRMELYEYIGHLAWRLSQHGEIDKARGKSIEADLRRPFVTEGLDALSIVPEFVAQIAGYTRSPQRREGLHLLVDCGAGTVDVVTFNVHRNPDELTDRYPIFAGRVKPLGGHFLMARRAEVLGAGLWDDLETIPTGEAIRGAFPEKAEELNRADNSFVGEVDDVVFGVITYTKAMRSPLAQAWIDGLPCFLTGGGAASDVYQRAVARANRASRGGFQMVEMPLPAGSSGIDTAAFHRMSVAYGLTFDRASLGEIIPPKDIENFLASDAYKRIERPDRDELYAK